MTSTTEESPDHIGRFSPVFAFEPDGLTFSEPANVAFRQGGSRDVAWWWSNGPETFEKLETTLTGEGDKAMATAEVTHFSKGFLGVPDACSGVLIPAGDGIADGDVGDWAGIAPIATDPAGDGDSTLAGSDIRELYLAQDDAKLFVRIELSQDANPALRYVISLPYPTATDDHWPYEFKVVQEEGEWTLVPPDSNWTDPLYSAIFVGVQGSTIEVTLPKNRLVNSGPFTQVQAIVRDGECADTCPPPLDETDCRSTPKLTSAPETGETCNGVTNGGSTVMTMEATDQDTLQEGGMIADGTYYLTQEKWYPAAGHVGLLGDKSGTLVISGPVWEFATNQGNMTVWVRTSDFRIYGAVTCPDTKALYPYQKMPDPSQPMWDPYLWPYTSFTVTGNTLVLASNNTSTIQTWTKQ